MVQRRSFLKAVVVSFLFSVLTVFGFQTEVVAGQLTLSWADNSTTEDGFHVERRPGTGTTFARIATVAANTASYTDSGLADASTYCYRVQAFNVAGNSGFSNEQCATTAAATTTFTLTVNKSGTGSGTVTSAPTGINCGATCSKTYNSGTSVVLTATAASGSTFAGWSGGGCTGTGTCTVSMRAATTVTATFNALVFSLTVSKSGTGSGTVTSAPTGINCGATCSKTYNSGTSVVLTATAASGSTFAGWSGGGCTGTGTCTVSMSAATTVTATFNALAFSLTVSKNGTGSGTVTSAPTGINCGATCSKTYNSGTSVVLTATAASGSTFAGWSGGGCTGTGSCTVSMSAATTVTATFNALAFSLTVSKSGTGSGTVTSAPTGINCGATCSKTYNSGTSVVLTATAASGSTFAGWSGTGCSTGTVTLNGKITCTATFNLNTFNISLNFDGWLRDRLGRGNLALSPDGSLDATFTVVLQAGSGGRTVTRLTLTRSDNIRIWNTVNDTRWALGAAGSLDTALYNAANASVNFAVSGGSSFKLFAADANSGSGYFTAGSVFTLTAAFSDGSVSTASATIHTAPPPPVAPTLALSFDGKLRDRVGRADAALSADGSLDGTFTVTVQPGSGNRTITRLTLRRGTNAGAWNTIADTYWALGAASSLNAALYNAANASVNFAVSGGSSFKLFAADASSGSGYFTAGSVFALTAAYSDGSSATASATIQTAPPLAPTTGVDSVALTVAKSGTGSGTVTGTGINCGADCTEVLASGTSVTLTATAASGSTFAGWSGGGCTGTGTCTITLSTNKSVTAPFVGSSSNSTDKIGVYRPSTGEWFLDLNGNGMLENCGIDHCVTTFSGPDGVPVVSDWDGSGVSQLGMFLTDTAQWWLDSNANENWDGCGVDFCLGPFGQEADIPISGKWNANGNDRIGVFRPSNGRWYLDSVGGEGKWQGCDWDRCAYLKIYRAGDLPVTGDWNGNGTTQVGLFRPATGEWFLDSNGNRTWDGCSKDRCLGPFGIAADLPVSGDWSGNGTSKIGVFRPSTGEWFLDFNGNGRWDGCAIDRCIANFGQEGDSPVVGKW